MRNARPQSIVAALIGVLLLAAWGEAEAQLRPASAEVVRANGRVEVLAKGQGQWAAASVGARLVEGDQIRALANSSADLNLPDGSTILVAENTRFAVTKLDYDAQTRDRNAAFNVIAGKVRAQVSQAAVQLARTRQSNFTVSTPGGVAAVRGTLVVVAYNPATNETIVFALPSPGQDPSAARITFVSRVGVQAVTLQGGQFTRQTGTGAPSAPQLISGLSLGAQGQITGPSNPSTSGSPQLTQLQVQVFDVQADQQLVITTTPTGAPVVTVVTAPTTTTVSTIGQETAGEPPPAASQ